MSRHHDNQRDAFADAASARLDLARLLVAEEGQGTLERLAGAPSASDVAARLPSRKHHHDSRQAMAEVAAILRSGDVPAIAGLHLRTGMARKAVQNAPGRAFRSRAGQALTRIDSALWRAAETVRGLAMQRCVRVTPGKPQNREDMLHAALIGAYQGAEKYDPEFGIAFSSYSVLWIDQAIQRCLEWAGGDIRFPTHIHESIRRLGRIRDRFRTEHGRWPTPEEVASSGGISLREARNVMSLVRQPRSLYGPLGSRPGDIGDELLVIDTVASDDALPDEAVDKMGRDAKLLQWLSRLTKREADIIVARFGLDGRRELLLKEIGKTYGVTHQRIRQIEVQAMANLRRIAKGMAPIPSTSKTSKRKLNLDIARAMRARRAEGADFETLANEFSISIYTVKGVIYNQSWKEPAQSAE